MQKHTHHDIVDVQGRHDSRELSINRVGVKSIRHPISVLQRNGEVQTTVAVCDLYASLNATQKGTHMSRFVELLNANTESFSIEGCRKFTAQIAQHLHSQDSYLTLKFPYFCQKSAPISGVTSLSDYDVSITAEFSEGKSQIHLSVVVPVTSLCPCSKEISQYGAHNQRSHVTISVFDTQTLWIEDIIDIIEEQASCELYAILKRNDEKYVTEKAYENPKFVEDIVRDIAAVLNAHSDVTRYQVTAENFESIHNHSAFAQIDK